jgi:RNA recognition motif-containing protein
MITVRYSVYVRGLPADAEEEEIIHHFSELFR